LALAYVSLFFLIEIILMDCAWFKILFLPQILHGFQPNQFCSAALCFLRTRCGEPLTLVFSVSPGWDLVFGCGFVTE